MNPPDRDSVRQTLRDDIPEDSLRFAFTRSSGPGGQNVNKTATRVTLYFDLAGSDALSAHQKRRIGELLAGRISGKGVLRVVSRRFRTQPANRRAAVERFYTLLADAVKPRTPRRATKVPARARRKRLANKRQRGEVKRLRQAKPSSSD